jgi:tripartite-type tricarboxylate transporter receptor subunit TctC
LYVGFAAGGPTDVVARVVGKALAEELRQPVVVENKPGASSTVAAAHVAAAPADGHSLLLVFPGLTGAESLYPQRKYDLTKDFKHVSLLGTSANFLLTSSASPFKTARDVVRLAAAQPGKFAYAHGGTGSMTHLSGEWLKSMHALDITSIGYRGSAPGLIDVAAGRVDFIFDQPSTAQPLMASGKLRALAVTSATRLKSHPDVPTMNEAGYPGFVVDIWYGLSVKAGTPEAVVRALSAGIQKVLERPEVNDGLARLGITASSSSPIELDARIKNEVTRWRDLIVKNKITAD